MTKGREKISGIIHFAIAFIKNNKIQILIVGLIIFSVTPYGFKIIKLTLSFLDYYSNGITALSALLATIFGILGINLWKKKIKGKLDIDIARNYLKAVLELRDAIKYVRNQSIPLSEMQDALKKQGFDPDDYEDRRKVNRAVYSLRWNKVQEVWTNLEAILLDAEISWGCVAVDVQKGLDALVRKIRGAIWLFINFPGNVKLKDKNWDLIYGTYDVNDKFSQEIDKEVEKIRKFLKNYL